MSEEEEELTDEELGDWIAVGWAEGLSAQDMRKILKSKYNKTVSLQEVREQVVQAEKQAMQLTKEDTDFWKGRQLARTEAMYRKAMLIGDTKAANTAMALQTKITGTVVDSRNQQIQLSILELAHAAYQRLMERRAKEAALEAKEAPQILSFPEQTIPEPEQTSGPFGGEMSFHGRR